MNKRVAAIIILIVTSVIVAGSVLWFKRVTKPGTDVVYLIPDGYKGCVGLFYNFKDEPPLKIEDNVITHQVPNDGILKTSSGEKFGWARKEGSGWHQEKYYYVDKNGEHIRELEVYKDIHQLGSTSLSFQATDGTTISLTYSKFFVGTEEESERSAACFNPSMREELQQIYYR